MSMESPKSGPTPLADAQAEVGREEWEQYKTEYLPFFDELKGKLSGSFVQESVNEAGKSADIADTVGQQVQNRNLARVGKTLDASQRQALNSGLRLNSSLNRVKSVNTARNDAIDTQDHLRSSLINHTQGVASEAMSDLNAGAGMETQRNLNNMNAQAAENNQYMQLGGMLLLSSKEKKKNIKPNDNEKSLQLIRKTDVKNYEYKDGEGQPGKRTGVIAEEMPEHVTADSKSVIKLGDYVNESVAAIKEVDKNLQDVSKRLKKLELKRVG